MTLRMGALGAGAALLLSALAATAGADPTGPAWTKDARGSSAIFKLATAPFPKAGQAYTDNSVLFFVPAGFRSGPKCDIVIHHHGHRNDVVNSDVGHRYREQFALSKKNAVLIQPQGPYHASDSSGGKLEDQDGLKRFIAECLSVLAREGVVPNGATLGTLVLSGHSGAYRVIARELDRGGVDVAEVDLHDAVYAELASFEAWAKKPGKRLVSAYTRNAGTADLNEQMRAHLQAAGLPVATNEEEATLASSRTFVVRLDVAHDASCYTRLRWAEVLKHSPLSDLGVPRARLRSVRGAGQGTVEVAWYPVRSALLRGYRLYSAPDAAGPFTLLQGEQTLGPSTTSTKVAQGSAAQSYRLAAVDDRGQESAASNVYASNPDGAARTRALVVDGFVRTNAGWKSYEHPFGAMVGSSARAAGRAFDTCRASAVTDGSVKLADYASVLWLAGDQSLEDAALTHDEQKAIAAYLAKGGTFLLSGAEVGYALGTANGSPDDRAFFAGTLHAAYAADSTPSRSLAGAATDFAGLSVTFDGATAPYVAKTPDVLAAGTSGATALRYGDGRAAGVSFEGAIGGTARSGVLVAGFPLECLDSTAARDALVARVLEWMDGVNTRAGR